MVDSRIDQWKSERWTSGKKVKIKLKHFFKLLFILYFMMTIVMLKMIIKLISDYLSSDLFLLDDVRFVSEDVDAWKIKDHLLGS